MQYYNCSTRYITALTVGVVVTPVLVSVIVFVPVVTVALNPDKLQGPTAEPFARAETL